MGSSRLFRVFGIFVLAACVAGAVVGLVPDSSRLKTPNFATGSEIDRRATLNALEEAWAARPAERTLKNARDQKDFINQTAKFVEKTHRKEVGTQAFAFYRRTLSDFFARYGSEDYLSRDSD